MKNHSLLIAMLIAANMVLGLIKCFAEEIDNSTWNEVYVVNHGWHTGFVIPASGIHQLIPELKNRFGNAPYIEFGWGDNEFYQAEEISSGITLKAIFLPTASVVHAVAVSHKADKYFNAVRWKSSVWKIPNSNPWLNLYPAAFTETSQEIY